MSDIVERLRNRERLCLEGIRPLVMACEEAATEIERLRSLNAELLAALKLAQPHVRTLNWNSEGEYEWLQTPIDAAVARAEPTDTASP